MKITCTADLHGYYPETPGGDLLIVAGDLTATDEIYQYFEFTKWLGDQKYRKKIVIGGNHDNAFVQTESSHMADVYCQNAEYLFDSGTEFEGLKMWGSPWTLTFPGINPRCMAFTGTHMDLRKYWNGIPQGIDILITHGPPYGILDQLNDEDESFTGAVGLREAVERVKPRIHIFGHIHEHGGQQMVLKHAGPNTLCINCSHVNERYHPVNEPVNFEIA